MNLFIIIRVEETATNRNDLIVHCTDTFVFVEGEGEERILNLNHPPFSALPLPSPYLIHPQDVNFLFKNDQFSKHEALFQFLVRRRDWLLWMHGSERGDSFFSFLPSEFHNSTFMEKAKRKKQMHSESQTRKSRFQFKIVEQTMTTWMLSFFLDRETTIYTHTHIDKLYLEGERSNFS